MTRTTKEQDSVSSSAEQAAVPTIKIRSRRGFLGVAGQVALGGAFLGRVGKAEAAPADDDWYVRAVDFRRGNRPSREDREFLARTYRTRTALARSDFEVPIAPHPTNGDEARYESKIGTDTRGLPHDGEGEVDPVAWQSAARAFASRDPADFDRIILGGKRKLVSPVSTLAAT